MKGQCIVGVKCETYPFAYKQTNTTFTNGFKGTGDSDVVIDENLERGGGGLPVEL